jgi:putative tryptophan/tyrosine transport system substrate-binding protein
MNHKLFKLSSTLLLAAASLASCNSSSSVKIGILQLVSAPPLNAVNDGFQKVISESDWAKNHTVEFNVQNPQLNQSTMATMATNLAANSSMVLGIATSASQSLKTAVSKSGVTIPVLFSAVTDPVSANLVTTTSAPTGTNVSGVSDMGDPKASFDVIDTYFASSVTNKSVAVIYNTSETNSIQQITLFKEEAAAKGWSVLDKAITEATQIETSLNAIPDDVKLLWYPTDNTVADNYATVAKVSKAKHLVAFGSDLSMLTSGGAIVAKGVDYNALGEQTGKLALSILSGEKKVEETQVGFAATIPLEVNTKLAADWGVSLPEALVQAAAADEVVSA